VRILQAQCRLRETEILSGIGVRANRDWQLCWRLRYGHGLPGPVRRRASTPEP
jgi:hypothetical protein